MDDEYKTKHYLEKTDPQKLLDELVADISKNHRKILEDWYKANVAQSYEETKEIRPCDYVLNQQPVFSHHPLEGRDTPSLTGYRYWFSEKTSGDGVTASEEKDGMLRITFAQEPSGVVTDFEIHPHNIRKLIDTLERVLGESDG